MGEPVDKELWGELEPEEGELETLISPIVYSNRYIRS